jgi:hypothetical protein
MADFGISEIFTAISALSAAAGGAATYVSSANNATISEYNAQVADVNAKEARDRAAVQQQEQDQKARALIGSQLAAQAASGVDVGSGSPKLTRISARELARMDALNIHQSGEIEANNYKTQATGFRMQAGADRSAGAFGLLNGFLQAGGVITNAKPVAKKNYYPPVPTPRPTLLS